MSAHSSYHTYAWRYSRTRNAIPGTNFVRTSYLKKSQHQNFKHDPIMRTGLKQKSVKNFTCCRTGSFAIFLAVDTVDSVRSGVVPPSFRALEESCAQPNVEHGPNPSVVCPRIQNDNKK